MDLIDLLLNKNSKIIDCRSGVEYDSDYMNTKSDSMAFFLTSKGLNSNHFVAISIKNSIEFIIAFLGTLKMGAVPLLFNTRWPLSYLENITYDFIIDFDTVNSLPANTFQKQKISDFFVLYTSGSNALPKSIKISTAKHLALIKSKSYNLNPSMKKIVMVPMCHMSSLSNIEVSLASGQSIFLMEKFNQKLLHENILKYRVNQIHAIPSHMRIFLDSATEKYLNVKSILLGGESTDSNLYSKLTKIFPNAHISTAYGSTELGPNLFMPHPDGLKTPPNSVGYPNSEIEYRIVNGILEVKSPYMMLGYMNKSESFTEDGFFITNDFFEVDKDGFYYCLGPANETFKSGGNRIVPSVIESVLKQYEKIQNAALVSVPDGQLGLIPIAFITSKEEVNIQKLLDFCRESLASFQLPKKIIQVPELPINSTGKIDKNFLRKKYET